MTNEVVAGSLTRLSPRIRRLTQRNPGIFTGPGTNTHLVGSRALFVIDPGEDDETHLRGLIEAVGNATVLGVIPTHAHPDHWPLAERLARHFGAPTYGFAASRSGFRPDRLVADGDVLEGLDVTLEAVHTPGHASDHLCYRFAQERALFSGDHVMGWSTTVIAPPDGDLNEFMASLDRLSAIDVDVMYPAHGAPIVRPLERLEELRAHRQERTRQALEAFESGPATIAQLVETIYVDVDRALHPAARMSLRAHIEALVDRGSVVVSEAAPSPDRVVYRLADQ